MEYRLGNAKKVKEKGETIEITCPNCKKLVKFGVFSNFERRLAVKKIPFDCQTIYFLVCPECASIYGVDEEIGEAFSKGSQLVILDNTLKPLKSFKTEI